MIRRLVRLIFEAKEFTKFEGHFARRNDRLARDEAAFADQRRR